MGIRAGFREGCVQRSAIINTSQDSPRPSKGTVVAVAVVVVVAMSLFFHRCASRTDRR